MASQHAPVALRRVANGGVAAVGRLPVHLGLLYLRHAAELPTSTRLEQRCVRALSGGPLVRADVVTLISTHRRPAELQEAVESALAQPVPDAAVVVVDDAAGLPTLPSDPRLHAFSLPEHSGIAGVVRNVGLALSQSRLVAFLDDDNTWTPDHLPAHLARHQGRAGNDPPLLTYSAVARRLERGVPLGEAPVHDVVGQGWDRRRFAGEAYVDTSAIVVTRTPGLRFSRLRRGRGEFPSEDWQLVWHCSRTHAVAHVPQVTVNYRLGRQNRFQDWENRLDPDLLGT